MEFRLKNALFSQFSPFKSGIPKANARVYEKSFLNLPYIAGLGMIIFLENEKKNLRRTKMKKKLEENENGVCSLESFFAENG